MRPSVILLLSLALAHASAEELYLFHSPTLSANEIVFAYAGDLWSVPRAGGHARRLTAFPGNETNPVFSPDGKTIAFSGEYSGGRAVYIMPASGGNPKCLTWNQAQQDWPVAWMPDGKRILFVSMGNSANDTPRLYTVDLNGGFPEPVPLPEGGEGSYSPDGARLAYVPGFQYQGAWRRYRGGQMAKIWIANLSDSSIVPIPHDRSNDSNPIWVGDRVYFLSDRNGPATLFRYDVRTHQIQEAVENHGFDFKSASAGPGAIVYEQLGRIGLYDLETGRAKQVPIQVAGDFYFTQRRTADVSGSLQDPSLAPDGLRAVFEARGEIFTIPIKGEARNVTNTTGAHEREPIWSPKGDRIAYLSDESGEYQLYLRDPNGAGEVRKFKLGDQPGFYSRPKWSPDGGKIAYMDAHLHLWCIDLADGKRTLVDTDSIREAVDLPFAWSPDGKWMATAKALRSRMRAIFLVSLADGKGHQMTDGMSDARYPAFDKTGQYLYFTSSTNSGPAEHEVDTQTSFRSSVSVPYVIVLAKGGASPAEGDDDKSQKSADSNTVKVDFDNIAERTFALTMPARHYDELHGGTRSVYAYATDPGAVYRFDLSSREEKTVASDVGNFVLSGNGERMLYRKDGNWVVTASDGSGNGTHTLSKQNLTAFIDPPAEFRQIYREAWLLMRELFYDPQWHGLDMHAAEKRYEPFLDNLSMRRDLNYLLTEAFGELSVSHLNVQGGDDLISVTSVNTGLLGADYTINHGRYRFQRIYRGEEWNPDTKAPFQKPGVNVQAGDYLLAVNGKELTGDQNIYQAFAGLADRQVALKVGADPSGAQSRQVTVKTVSDESTLRYLAWIEDNRRLVDRLSGGRIAYLHMPDTAKEGATSFIRYFYPQVDRQGAIIDDRFNHGGHFASDIMDFLRRSPITVFSPRDGADWQAAPGIYGPKAMLINQYSASGGDMMPSYFRRLGLGTLIGETTWGGTRGVSSSVPALMDGGTLRIPQLALWIPGIVPELENRGTAPDIEVPMDPKAVREGHDPQLEEAVAVVLAELARHPVPELKRPVYPKYK